MKVGGNVDMYCKGSTIYCMVPIFTSLVAHKNGQTQVALLLSCATYFYEGFLIVVAAYGHREYMFSY